MKTKSFKFLMLAFAMLSLTVVGGVLLTACGHQHSYTYELVEENGHSHRRICKGCGEEEIEECTIEIVEESDATCDEPRKIVHRCNVCLFSHTHTEGEARGHDWGQATPLYQDDDTTDDNPGEYLKKHIQYCKHDNTHTTEPVDCKFERVETKEATCSEAGFTKHICVECGGFYITDEKSATGHQFGDWTSEGQDGHFTHYRICSNENCDLPEHRFVEDCADDGADMILQSFTGATCDAPSEEVFKCSKCQRQVTTHTVAALGHLYDKYEYLSESETPRHKKICTRPLEEGGTCGHFEEEDCDCLVKVKPATCLEAGYTEHTCIHCNNSYQDQHQQQLEHKWTKFYKNKDGLHVRDCLEGNHSESHEANYHTETTNPADCENPERKRTECQFDGCDYVEDFLGSPATGHLSSGWTHFMDGEKHMHKKYCIVCETVLEQEECKMTTRVIAPTCTDGGYTTHFCSECAHQYDDEQTVAKGHKWSENWNEDGDRHWRLCENDAKHIQEHLIEKSESVQLPNCTQEGKLTITCLHKEDGVQCTISNESVIEPLGHMWNVGEKTTIVNEHQGHVGAKCLRPDCNETHTGAHQYTKNNLCDMCGWDGLVYSVKGDGTAVVLSDKYVENVKEIVISDKTPMWNSGEEIAENQVLGGFDVVGIGIGAFQQNQNVEKITLGKNIVEIKDSAAFSCPKLKTVVFNNVLQTIRATAFQYCSMLDTLVVMGADGEIQSQTKVPTTITYISSSAFKNTAFERDAANWTDVTYHKPDETQEVVGKALILHDQLLGVKLDEGKDTFEVPENITSIAENVFSEMKNLVTVVLPNTITKIGANAFYGCDNLMSAIFRGTVAEWLGISFGNDFSSPTHYAKTFTIKDVSSELTINDNVTTIPAGCFYGDALQSVVIGENVTSIGAGAFENCENLASVTILSKKLKYIGENAFKGTKFFNTEGNWDASGALYIDGYLIAVKETAVGTEARQVSESETRMVFAVKEGTTLIACGAFRNCSKLQHIEIAITVERIGTNAFAGCTLSTLTIKDTEHDWMIWTNQIGRVLDVTDAANLARHAPNLYVGEWYWYEV